MTTSRSETVATSVKEVLVAARWIVENIGWCQRAAMIDKKGKRLNVLSGLNKEADAFCMAGAVNVVNTGNDFSLVADSFKLLNKEADGNFITWNDTLGRTKEEVLALFDRVIEKC